uniref:Uncharacterized protein n=1 Tax=Palpitomonas bilix TaxID=652834 RepID=A0A7S3G4X4_9EUKA|mmetsp:Transcript_19339/g.49598  ORF Transcript_19339/g.49598 Transcript_19339/m.49598 type:complete len:542 (+) Transcript_19339:3-1628(+)
MMSSAGGGGGGGGGIMGGSAGGGAVMPSLVGGGGGIGVGGGVQTNAGSEIEGYLFLRKSGAISSSWSRRWCVLSKGDLAVYKEGKMIPDRTMSLLLCSVSEYKDTGLRFCFKVTSSGGQSEIFQCQNRAEMELWFSCLVNAISEMINHQRPRGETKKTIVSNRASSRRSVAAIHAVRLNPDNLHCADCGASDPDWVSINLGAVICLDCSGVHRSLGTHISKVRSATLDDLDESVVQVLKGIGNAGVNEVFGTAMPTASMGEEEGEDSEKGREVGRINADSTREEREGYIKAKYVQKAYLSRDVCMYSAEKKKKMAGVAIRDNNMVEVLRLVVAGWSANTGVIVPNNDDERGGEEGGEEVAIAYAIKCERVAIAELLYQNGASLEVVNSEGDSLAHIAVETGCDKALRFLLLKGAPMQVENASGKTAADIADEKDQIAMSARIRAHLPLEEGREAAGGGDSEKWSEGGGGAGGGVFITTTSSSPSIGRAALSSGLTLHDQSEVDLSYTDRDAEKSGRKGKAKAVFKKIFSTLKGVGKGSASK